MSLLGYIIVLVVSTYSLSMQTTRILRTRSLTASNPLFASNGALTTIYQDRKPVIAGLAITTPQSIGGRS